MLDRHVPLSGQLKVAKAVALKCKTLEGSFEKLIKSKNPASHIVALCRPGGYSGAAAPDPIPNSAVKRSCADGTLS